MLSSHKLVVARQRRVSHRTAFMRSPTTHKVRAVKNLDAEAEDVVLSSHDGCFCHFLNYSFWPRYDANAAFSTSELSESGFSQHACHDVVNNQSGVMKNINVKGDVDRIQCLSVILTS